MLQIATQFDRAKIDKSQDYVGHLMVSITAPEDKGSVRTPISTALVLDVSGSMGGFCPDGRNKLEAVKDTAAKLIQHLTDKDEVAVIAYSDNVMVLVQRMKAANKEAINLAVEKLQTLGITNLSGGLLEGLNQINKDFQGVRRVLLLTDGLPTAGVLDKEQLLKLVRDRQDKTTTLSTFGFGNDADQELLASMAKEGGGNYYYISGGKDVRAAFARELGGMISCQAQNIQVKIKPNKGNGNEILEVLNDYNVTQEGDDDSVAVIAAEDVYAGESKHILVKMQVKKPNGHAKDRPFSIAHVDVLYDETKTGERRRDEFNVKVEFVKPEEADKDPVLAVAEQVGILNAAIAQLRAVNLANQGDFSGAQMSLASATEQLFSLHSKGSALAGQAEFIVRSASADFHQGKYSQTHANRHLNSARATMRHKAAGTGGQNLSELYKTSTQNAFEAAFEKDDPSATPKKEPEVQQPPANVTPPSHKSKFTKSKKRGR
jgi:Ca-activated chloride channel homolog